MSRALLVASLVVLGGCSELEGSLPASSSSSRTKPTGCSGWDCLGETPPVFGSSPSFHQKRLQGEEQRNQPIQSQPRLVRFEDCAALEQHLEDAVLDELRTSIMKNLDYAFSSSRFGYGSSYCGYYGDGGDGFGPQGFDAGMAGAGAPADSKANGAAAPGAFTGTNIQVAGVDEADVVKTDGVHVFSLAKGKLFLSRSWPADQLAVVSSVDIEGTPRELMLLDNKVVVFSSDWSSTELENGTSLPEDGSSTSPARVATRATVVDVSDLASPQVLSEYEFTGEYLTSRRVGTSVRIVLNEGRRLPNGLQWAPPCKTYPTTDDLVAEYAKLMAHNEAVVREQPVEFWLPQASFRQAGQQARPVPFACTEFLATTAPANAGAFTVATMDLSNPGKLAETTVLSRAAEVYSSAQALYVVNEHRWAWPQPGQQTHSYLYKFDISNPSAAIFQAAGGVSGVVCDQFSMDENQGYLRLATTTSTRSSGDWWSRPTLTNQVLVLAQHGASLDLVGSTPALAPGERVFSARFMGDRGYVVTFRQTDPLFTFDLSVPTAPRQVGELHVPGVSTYIHPIDLTHLLTVGNETGYNRTTQRWERNVKLSVFDVTDLAHPTQAFTLMAGTGWGYSSAEGEHKAFNYFPEKKLLAIPYNDDGYYSGATPVSELRVFRVDVVAGLSPVGAISVTDLATNPCPSSPVADGGTNWACWALPPSVERSIMADDFVYALSHVGIRVAETSALSTPLATALYP